MSALLADLLTSPLGLAFTFIVAPTVLWADIRDTNRSHR